MATTLVIRAVLSAENGSQEVQFEWDGMPYSLKFSSRDALISAGTMLQRPAEALKVLLAWWLSQDPTASDPSKVIGKELVFDTAGTPLLKKLAWGVL